MLYRDREELLLAAQETFGYETVLRHRAQTMRAQYTADLFAAAFLSFAAVGRKIAAKWRDAVLRRKAVAELTRMSDYELRDIGIGRGDIASAVDGIGAYAPEEIEARDYAKAAVPANENGKSAKAA